MDFLSVIMGIADLICVVLILLAYGLNIFTLIISGVMLSKGVMSFL